MNDRNPEDINRAASLALPQQYLDFWKKLCGIYGLHEGALGQLASELLIVYLNSIHDDIESFAPLSLSPEDIREDLSLKNDPENGVIS